MKAALILPYFGRFGGLFPLWLRSCQHNPQIDWLIFSDQKFAGSIPPNVHFYHMQFEDLRRHIQQKYNFEVSLKSPYRLCNFKPAYGDIFSDYLTSFDYWGYCDCDLIWGKIGEYFSQNCDRYDRMGSLGHFTLLRNTEELIHLYRKDDAFRIAFSYDYSFLFDEIGFRKICQSSPLRCAPEPCLADFHPRHFNFDPVISCGLAADLPWQQIFTWENGILLRWAVVNGCLVNHEVLYIHFLKRFMDISPGIETFPRCMIVPNRIFPSQEKISAQMVLEYSRRKFYFDYWRRGLTPTQIAKKIRHRFSPTRKKLMREIVNLVSVSTPH